MNSSAHVLNDFMPLIVKSNCCHVGLVVDRSRQFSQEEKRWKACEDRASTSNSSSFNISRDTSISSRLYCLKQLANVLGSRGFIRCTCIFTNKLLFSLI